MDQKRKAIFVNIYKSNNSELGPMWSLMDEDLHLLAVCHRVNPKTGLGVSLDEAERILHDDAEKNTQAGGVMEEVAEDIAKEDPGPPYTQGCGECGMAYSFFYGTQFHKADCSEGAA